MVDDHSRLAYSEILTDERAPTSAQFMECAIGWFSNHGFSAITTNDHTVPGEDGRQSVDCHQPDGRLHLVERRPDAVTRLDDLTVDQLDSVRAWTCLL